MHETKVPNRAGLTPEFEDGVTAFIEWAKSQHAYIDGEKIKCPCLKCKNEVFKTLDEVNFDLYIKCFMLEYYYWTLHSEERVQEYFEASTPVVGARSCWPAIGLTKLDRAMEKVFRMLIYWCADGGGTAGDGGGGGGGGVGAAVGTTDCYPASSSVGAAPDGVASSGAYGLADDGVMGFGRGG
ncbi:UNVERIFIED_CONTAM: hypothetical protein Sradi_7027400 [Sesamum radiatum]|uniref:Transposase-associated domain-containing protein n=1 Tax=Sesamum radiatum TaxID=300843 RepID=A0AAW2JB38_SESRA